MAATLDPILTVSGTPLIWIARSGPEHERYGDPYDVACVVIKVDPDTARIEALSNGTEKSATRALLEMREVLRREGFTQVLWERLRNVKVQL